MSNLKNTSFLQLLPDSLKYDPDAIAAAQALSRHSILNEEMDELLVLFNPANLVNREEQFLDYLFRQEHVDVLSVDLTKAQKADLIFNSPAIHMKKGTAWAVQQVVSSVIAKAKVIEWFEYGGSPYMFQIEIETSNVKAENLSKLREVVETTKNLRSSMEGIVIILGKPKIQVKALSTDFKVLFPITNTFVATGEEVG